MLEIFTICNDSSASIRKVATKSVEPAPPLPAVKKLKSTVRSIGDKCLFFLRIDCVSCLAIKEDTPGYCLGNHILSLKGVSFLLTISKEKTD